jgi:hypothetical protein
MSGSAPRASTKLAALRFVDRFTRLRRRALLVRAALLAAGVFLTAAALLVALDLVLPLPAQARAVLRLLPMAAALALLLAAVVQAVRHRDARVLALGAEEREPRLEGYLTTALDADARGPVGEAFARQAQQRLEALYGALRVPVHVTTAMRPVFAGSLLLVLVLAFGGPARVWERWLRPADAEAAGPRGGSDGAQLPPEIRGPLRVEIVRWTITPPSYTGLPVRDAGDASLLEALPGSRIRLEARPPGAGVELVASVVGGAALRARPGELWSAEWILGSEQRGVSVELVADGEIVARRVVPIRVREDAEPDVRLAEPDDDMVVGTARGTLRVRATARDEFGVEQFHLAWIHSSGSGESFSFRQGEWSFDAVHERDGGVHGEFALDLASVGMQPGDVLHVRAVARDGNTVTGPGEGVSRTRVIRVARAEEAGEITTLIGFPLEAEHDPILSQRMIILMTERLRDETPRLDRDAVLHESNHIGDEQGRLRGQVGEEIYVRLSAEDDHDDDDGVAGAAAAGHDHSHAPGRGADSAAARGGPTDSARIARILEAASRATGSGTLEESMHFHDASPILSMNPLKLAAFNAMWSAERELRQGRPADALPHQYEALEYIQQMREADRVFVRGRQTVAPIDVGAIRGTGRLTGAAPAARTRAEAAADASTHRADLDAVMAEIGIRTGEILALDFAALAVRMLRDPGVDPDAATLVSQAADALSAGDATRARALALRARAALAPVGGAGGIAPLRGARSPASAAYLQRIGGDG